MAKKAIISHNLCTTNNLRSDFASNCFVLIDLYKAGRHDWRDNILGICPNLYIVQHTDSAMRRRALGNSAKTRVSCAHRSSSTSTRTASDSSSKVIPGVRTKDEQQDAHTLWVTMKRQEHKRRCPRGRKQAQKVSLPHIHDTRP